MDPMVSLGASLGIANTLKELGSDEARTEEPAEMAAADPIAATNPVSLDGEALKSIRDNALDGRFA